MSDFTDLAIVVILLWQLLLALLASRARRWCIYRLVVSSIVFITTFSRITVTTARKYTLDIGSEVIGPLLLVSILMLLGLEFLLLL